MYTRCISPLEESSPEILQDYTSKSVDQIRGHPMVRIIQRHVTDRAVLAAIAADIQGTILMREQGGTSTPLEDTD